MEVLVEFDYTADETDELTIHKGDILKQVSQFEEGWFIGNLNGKVGVFPDNFVKVLSKPHESSKLPEENFSNKQNSDAPKSNLINPKTPMGIGLGNIFNGQPIQLTQTGIRDVKRITDQPSRELNDNNNQESNLVEQDFFGKERVKTRFEYEPKQPDELHLHLDDIIVVFDKNLPDEGWWRGYNLNTKQTGLFPDNFVELIPIEQWKIQGISRPSTGQEPPKILTKPMTNGGALRYPGPTSVGNQNSNQSNFSDSTRNVHAFPRASAPSSMSSTHPGALKIQSDSHVEQNDIPVASLSHNEPGSPNGACNQRPTPLTIERPRQVGKRLPSKVSNATNPVPIRPQSETLEFMKFDDHNLDPLAAVIPTTTNNGSFAKNSGSQLTGLNTELNNHYLKRSVSGTFTHPPYNNLTNSPTKNVQSQLDLLKEQNAQIRVDMHRIQKVLTDRVQSLMIELDEIKKARAGDAVEIARLRQLVMQMDAQALIGSERIYKVNGDLNTEMNR